jgi:hypothetical protein
MALSTSGPGGGIDRVGAPQRQEFDSNDAH